MAFENEKFEHCLRVWGPMFDLPQMAAEGLKPDRHFFDTIDQLWYFNAELHIKAAKLNTKLFFEIRSGKHVRFYTVVKLLFLCNFNTYPVEHSFDEVVDDRLAAEAFKDGGRCDCDCVRSALIRKYHKEPNVEILPCGHTIELLKICIEQRKREEQLR